MKSNQTAMNLSNEKMVAEAKRIEEDTVCSAYGHFVAARFWSGMATLLGLPTVVLASAAGAVALSAINRRDVIAGALSILVAVLSAASVILNPQERAHNYLEFGNRYNALKNRARIFYEIEVDSIGSRKELVDHLKELGHLRDELNAQAPQLPTWAYKRARKDIIKGYASYKIDDMQQTKLTSS